MLSPKDVTALSVGNTKVATPGVGKMSGTTNDDGTLDVAALGVFRWASRCLAFGKWVSRHFGLVRWASRRWEKGYLNHDPGDGPLDATKRRLASGLRESRLLVPGRWAWLRLLPRQWALRRLASGKFGSRHYDWKRVTLGLASRDKNRDVWLQDVRRRGVAGTKDVVTPGVGKTGVVSLVSAW
jgi:hypothetical protein